MTHRKRIANLEQNIRALVDIQQVVVHNEAELDYIHGMIKRLQKRYHGLTHRYIQTHSIDGGRRDDR